MCGVSVWLVIVVSCSVWHICLVSEKSLKSLSFPFELQALLFVQIHPWVNFESLLQKCLVGRLVQSSRNTGSSHVANKTTGFITKLFAKRGRMASCCAVCVREKRENYRALY